MTDKLQKIRKEVARIQAYTQSDVLKEVLDYIDKVQEEPVSEEWIEELRTKLDSLSKEDFKKVFDKYAVDFNEEPVSEDLEKIVEEIAEPTILNAYGTKELARRLRRTMIEPVGEELEEAANEIVNKAIPPLAVKYKDGTYVGGIMDYFDRKEFIDLVKAGAKWQKTKDESTTEDLGDYINELSKQFSEVSFAKLSRIAVRVAKWQLWQINEVLLSEVLPCFMHGGEADEVVAKLDEVLNQK